MKFHYLIHILLFYILLFSACGSSEEPVAITYKVKASPDYPLTLMITYRDSCGDVTITTTETKWAKEVTLPPASLATLLVTIVSGSRRPHTSPTLDPPHRRYHIPLLSGWIIHPRKTVEDHSDYLILVSMGGLDVR